MELAIKCLKTYLNGAKCINNDNKKAYEYFLKCSDMIESLTKTELLLEDDIVEVIHDTKINCNLFLESTNCINSEQLYDTSIDLFKIIKVGDFHKLKSYKYNMIQFNTYNDNGVTPLHYALEFSDVMFLKKAFKLGGGIDSTTIKGHTLLEYACILKDPNMISFLLKYGANIQKHVYFREKNTKYLNKGLEIDIILITQLILDYDSAPTIENLNWIFKYINKDTLIDLAYLDKDIYFEEFIYKLEGLLSTFIEDSKYTYINIIKEELQYELENKIYCPRNKIEILLYNLIPFINYSFNLYLNWLIIIEIKFLYLKNKKLYKKDFNISLKNDIIEKYVKTNILSLEYIKNYINF